VRSAVLALALCLAACGGVAPSPELLGSPATQPTGWKALLIAGDDAEPAFDNAVDAMAEKLRGFGVPAGNITTLKSDGADADAATRANIESAFAKLAPGPRDGCFVFITSHGMPRHGLVLSRARAMLEPPVLSELLDRSCAGRPTVVIASGCFSGAFAQGRAMPEPNRVILTAARADRPSFGCNAGLTYTYFDRCVLENLIKGVAWPVVMDKARDCVTESERKLKATPSEPQISVGAQVEDLRVFAR
jgi:hypothetical protein